MTRTTMSALGLALAIAAGSAAAPAAAQQAQAQAQVEAPQIKPSRGAIKSLQALQKAVEANDAANIPARIAEAEAAAKTAEDRFLIAGMRYKAAIAAKDEASKAVALEQLASSGLMQPADLPNVYAELVNAYKATGQADKAAVALDRLLQVDPNNVSAVLMAASLKKDQGKAGEAVGLLQKSILQAKASGAKADERLYRHAVQLAYEAKHPATVDLSRAWVEAYPTSENWRNALRIYRNMEKPPETILVDALRLGRAVNALEGTVDYHPYAFAAIEERAPNEAKIVVEEGIAAGKINGSEKLFRDILAEANTKSAGQKDRLPALTRDAKAASSASMAMTAGNIHYGYGNYAEAADLYRAALEKSGVDKDLANLRLGMSLARAGDKAAATAHLNAVGGPRAEVAKFWLLYLQTAA